MLFKKLCEKLKQREIFLHRVKKLRALSVDNDIDIATEDISFVKFRISGKNNKIKIGKLSSSFSGQLKITIAGNNNTVIIEPGLYVSHSLEVVIGQKHPNFGMVSGCSCLIGERVSMELVNITTYNSNSSIVIGDRCMFSFNIALYHTDGHPILDYQTKKIINKVKEMRIGNHVWVGAGATVLKNTKIPDNSIVGWGAVVSGKYQIEPGKGGIVLVGNPACVVKPGIDWDSCGANGYVQNEI